MNKHHDILFCSIGLLLVICATVLITSLYPKGQIPLFIDVDRSAILQQEAQIKQMLAQKTQALKNEEYEKSLKLLESLEEHFPNNRALLKERSSCLIALKALTEAQEILLDLLPHHQLDAELYASLASIALQQNKSSQAAHYLSQLRKLQADSTHLAFLSIAFFQQTQQREAAQKALQHTQQKYQQSFEQHLRDPLLKALMQKLLVSQGAAHE